MPPHRRRPVTRRPRVAGRRPGDPAGRPAGESEQRLGGGPAAGVPTEPDVQASRWSGVATLVALVAVVVIAVGLAAWFRGEANQLSGSAAASNTALVDVGATAQVSGQVRDAVQRIYSYDFARLDDNERADRAVIAGSFAQEFQQQFALVRRLAPAQQAVVVATVLDVGVKELDGDRALLVVFIDQQAGRGIRTPQLSVAGRLSVTAQRVDGNWKIADVQPF
ncbi:MAG: hypothetical protein ACRDSP_02170 [Pseudonocardiaceae bacterium]